MNKVQLDDRNKLNFVIDKFRSIEYKNKKYKLIVVSCYFRTNTLKRFIENIRKIDSLYLNKVELYLDRKQVFLQHEELNSPFFREQIIEFKIPLSKQLFHPKAYALVVDDSFINLTKGNHENCLVLGSANLTQSGFGLSVRNNNQELMYCTQDSNDIKEFCSQLPSDSDTQGLNETIESELRNEDSFMFNLVQAGNLLVSGKGGSIETKLKVTFNFREGINIENIIDVDLNGDQYYFYDGNKDENNHLHEISKHEEKFKQSKEYKTLNNIFLRANISRPVNWGEIGVKIFDSFYWFPKDITEYLTTENLASFLEELKAFFTPELKQIAVQKLAIDIHKFYSENLLDSDWIDKKLKRYIDPENKCLDAQKAAQKIIDKKIEDFIKYSDRLLYRYEIKNELLDLSSSGGEEDLSKNEGLTKVIYQKIKNYTNDYQNHQTSKKILAFFLKQAINNGFNLSAIQFPHINRLDFLGSFQEFSFVLLSYLNCLEPLTFKYENIKNRYDRTIEQIQIFLKNKKNQDSNPLGIIEIYHDFIDSETFISIENNIKQQKSKVFILLFRHYKNPGYINRKGFIYINGDKTKSILNINDELSFIKEIGIILNKQFDLKIKNNSPSCHLLSSQDKYRTEKKKTTSNASENKSAAH